MLANQKRVSFARENCCGKVARWLILYSLHSFVKRRRASQLSSANTCAQRQKYGDGYCIAGSWRSRWQGWSSGSFFGGCGIEVSSGHHPASKNAARTKIAKRCRDDCGYISWSMQALGLLSAAISPHLHRKPLHPVHRSTVTQSPLFSERPGELDVFVSPAVCPDPLMVAIERNNSLCLRYIHQRGSSGADCAYWVS
jgi:hypothetical protein